MSRPSPSPSGSRSAFRTGAPAARTGAVLDRVAVRTPDGSTLFDNLNLAFHGERTGVVGRNGVGKSTLLRVLVGEQPVSEGTVWRSGSVGVLAQRVEPSSGETVACTLGIADGWVVVARVLAGEGTADDLTEADWGLEARTEAALEQVGLAGLDLSRATADLSGGEQTRVRLAALLIAAPDLLLLDEPTNHLDAEGRAIVAEVLGRWTGGAVVVSHDRELLRRMDRIVELSSLGASIFGGSYDLYVERKTAERAAAERDLASAGREVERVQREGVRAVEKKARRDRAGRAFAASGSAPRIVLGMMAERAETSGAREGRLAERRLEGAEAALSEARARVERVRELSIPLPPSGLAAGRTVLRMDRAVWATAQGRRIVGPLDLSITGPRRVAITGRNGAGKTTVLRLAVGLLEPTSGSVERPVRVAMLDQDVGLLRVGETLVEAFRRLNPEAEEQDARAALARFLFRNVAGDKRVEVLSGGERLRAGLACALGGDRPAQLLVLDEPTNHLDLDAIAAVEAALRAYDGALIVVSHDAAFLEALRMDEVVGLDGAEARGRGTAVIDPS